MMIDGLKAAFKVKLNYLLSTVFRQIDETCDLIYLVVLPEPAVLQAGNI